MKEDQQPFIYPLPFEQFSKIRSAEKIDYSIKDYHQIVRLKKMLQSTQQKMENRIKLFKKTTQRMIKKKNQQHFVAKKVVDAKENKSIMIRKTPQRPFSIASANTCSNNTTYLFKQKSGNRTESECKSSLADKLSEIKINNVKAMREQKQRIKLVLAEKQKFESTRKLKSAQLIRRNRENARLSRMELEKQRKQQFSKFIEEKIKRQKEHYLELQKNLQFLQMQERQALINWKRVIDDHQIEIN